MVTKSTATTEWNGSLQRGTGSVMPESGVFGPVELNMPARQDRSKGGTSPEELIAAAHSSCFCMALAGVLGSQRSEQAQFKATARIDFIAGEGIKSSRLAVEAVIPDIDREQFDQIVAKASEVCPVSAALRGNVELSVDASLQVNERIGK